MAGKYGVNTVYWDSIMNTMTPGNLLKLGSPNLTDIANCLGLGREFERYIQSPKGMFAPETTQLNKLMNDWISSQKDGDNLAVNFIAALKSESNKKGYDFSRLIAQLEEKTGLLGDVSYSFTKQSSVPFQPQHCVASNYSSSSSTPVSLTPCWKDAIEVTYEGVKNSEIMNEATLAKVLNVNGLYKNWLGSGTNGGSTLYEKIDVILDLWKNQKNGADENAGYLIEYLKEHDKAKSCIAITNALDKYFNGKQGEQEGGSASSDDEELKKELERNGIGALYSKLHTAQVDINILWNLNDELIKLCNLTPIEKLKYETAKDKRSG